MDRLRLATPPVRQDATYVAPLQSRIAASKRTAWTDIKETGELVSALGQGIQKGGDWVAKKLKPYSHGSPLPGVISGLGRSIGGTVDAVGCLPKLGEALVKDPKKVGKTMVASVPHLLDDYKTTWKEQGPIASLTQAGADVFGGGVIKKGLGLGKTAAKTMTRQMVKQEVKNSVKQMTAKSAWNVVRHQYPDMAQKQFRQLGKKQQKQLTKKALTKATRHELKHAGKVDARAVRTAVKHSVQHPPKWLHYGQHTLHHALHWFGEETAKHTAKGVARPGQGH